MLPTVVFCFSRKRVEMMADYFTAKDFMSAAEKSSVHRFCEQALERLKPADRRLPQIARLRGMLGRGMAVHHAGMLTHQSQVAVQGCASCRLESKLEASFADSVCHNCIFVAPQFLPEFSVAAHSYASCWSPCPLP